MDASDQEVRLAGTYIKAASHICAFFHDKDEEYRTLLPFMVDGLAQGNKLLLIINEIDRHTHMRLLSDGGIDVAAAEKRGQFALMSWPRTLMRGRSLDAKTGVEVIDQLLTDARRQGHSRTRLIGDWAPEEQGAADQFICLESLLDLNLSNHGDTVICAYDLTRFNGTAVLDAMRTHPFAVVGGVVQQNPFYVPPQELLGELRRKGICDEQRE